MEPHTSIKDNGRYRADLVKPPTLYIVVPCFNEEDIIMTTIKQLSELMQSLIHERWINEQSKMLYVDDGSRDSTWLLLSLESSRNHMVSALKLARNAGHQRALVAGLMYAREYADCVISMDADLQDDIRIVREFMQRYHEGHEIVYGIRQDRSTDSWFKRWSAESYYKLMNRMGVPIMYNHADYRLMSKRALQYLAEYHEVNLFLRGIVPQLGLRSSEVYYSRKERIAGTTKYPLRKMLSLGWEGVTSFSIKPMRVVTWMGVGSLVISLIAVMYALLSKWIGNTVSGWTSIMASVWFIGSIQMLAVGVIGEYIGKMYSEVKHRPLYFIDEVVHHHVPLCLDELKEAGGENG